MKRDYTTADLCRAYVQAEARGPRAVEMFLKRLNQASDRCMKGEPVDVAFFDLLAEACSDEKAN